MASLVVLEGDRRRHLGVSTGVKGRPAPEHPIRHQLKQKGFRSGRFLGVGVHHYIEDVEVRTMQLFGHSLKEGGLQDAVVRQSRIQGQEHREGLGLIQGSAKSEADRAGGEPEVNRACFTWRGLVSPPLQHVCHCQGVKGAKSEWQSWAGVEDSEQL